MSTRWLTALPLFALGCATPSDDADTDGTADTDAATTADDDTTDDDTTDGSSGDDTDGPTTPTSELVDPSCLDGQYAEELADPDADLEAVIASFTVGEHEAFVSDALAIRYPIGAFIFDEGRATSSIGDCVAQFTTAQDRGSATRMLRAASTLVHECGHFFDIDSSPPGKSRYHVSDTLTLTCGGGSYATLPARSRLQSDDWAPLRPACPNTGTHGCDSYADVYLDGNPDNQKFESGDQALDMLLEEAVQYVNSLATDRAFADALQKGASISAEDGILTFLWYTERYLHLLRTTDPSGYDDVIGSACWRELILTVWGRAWLFLDDTEGQRALNLDGADLRELVQDPDLLDEIQRVRDAEGCE